MANRNAPSGFTLISPFNGAFVERVSIAADYSQDLAKGDVVHRTGTADAKGRQEIEVLDSSSHTNAMGVITGFEGPPDRDNLIKTYSPTDVIGVALVYTDYQARYLAQEDSDGGFIPILSVGLLIDLIDATPNTTTGVSTQQLDSSLATTSGTFRLISIYEAPDNALGNYARWVVSFAEHENVSGAVSV